MRVALYARVSTEEQVQGSSIEGQLDAMCRYARERGWAIAGEYVDAGFSARTDDRPEFKRMIADAKMGKFDVIMVLRGDRFARNRMHATMYKQLLKEVGVRVVSVTEPVEEGTPTGIIVEGMNEVIAEWYSVDLSVKITEAKRRRAEKGLWNGPVPFGYEARGDALVVVQEEAQLVRRAFEMYGSGGYTYQQVATWLNQSAFRPRAHRKNRKGREYLWSKDTVKDMLRNVFYLGFVKHKQRTLEGRHEAIVTRESLDKVQQVRREHYRGPSTFAQRYRTYLLKGLLRCIHCGEKLWAQHIGGKDYYREESALRGIPCANPRAYVRAEIL
ncbi:MAG: recombinase family protein, partial [Bacillota bacterium]|nr:recombinase family protein [Bacillota bacterium]